jgi:hypothetical protein
MPLNSVKSLDSLRRAKIPWIFQGHFSIWTVQFLWSFWAFEKDWILLYFSPLGKEIMDHSSIWSVGRPIQQTPFKVLKTYPGLVFLILFGSILFLNLINPDSSRITSCHRQCFDCSPVSKPFGSCYSRGRTDFIASMLTLSVCFCSQIKLVARDWLLLQLKSRQSISINIWCA